MTSSARNPFSVLVVRLLALLFFCSLTLRAQDAQSPLPIYIEDNHAGTFHFLATTLDLSQPHILVLIDAHSDSSTPEQVDILRSGLRQVATTDERENRIRAWRHKGSVQAFDWILPLMPIPVAQVIWVRPEKAKGVLRTELPEEALPSGYKISNAADFESRIPVDLPVVVSIDLDSFTGLPPAEQLTRFLDIWTRVLHVPRLAAITFAISRPWLSDDAEASRLLLATLESSLSLAHATVRFEPFGIEGPDRSTKAKEFYAQRKEPPRFDPETASPELRSLLMANSDRLDVRLDPARWQDLLDRWRSEESDWRVSLTGIEPDSDQVYRPDPEVSPDLHIDGGSPGLIRRVTWIQWTPKAWSYNVLPELPSGKAFAGAAPPVMEYEATVLAQSQSLSLGAEVWKHALPGPDQSGVLRVSAELETEAGLAHTARIEIRRGLGTGFHAGLSEQFGLPYVFGAGYLRRGALRGPDTGVGNDCANFLIYAWRHSGLRIPWGNPAQLKRWLTPLDLHAHVLDRGIIPKDASVRGLVIHLGSHVAALWEDRKPIGTLGPEDLVVHHLGGAPEVISLGDLLDRRKQATFDVYLGPPREPIGWIAIGGDLMPGEDNSPPPGLHDQLAKADLAVANLETTISRGGKVSPKRYVFRIPAARTVDLHALGITALSLSNNHAGDYDVQGLKETMAALRNEGIGYFGAGMNTHSAVSAWYGHLKGLTVAFIGVSLADPELLPAGARKPGMAVVQWHEREITEALTEARKKADCVIVLPHWGEEGTTVITEEQHRWAGWFIDHGADAIVGSGPHVIQTHETISGAPVYYSLGNLWFRGPWPPESRKGGIALLGLDQAGRIVQTRLETLSNEAKPSGAQEVK